MAKHNLEKGLSKLEEQSAEVRDQADAAFAEMDTAISSGSRTAQTKALATLKGLFEVSHNLIGATHSHATALMVGHTPAPAPVEQAAEAKVAHRSTRTSVPQGE